MLHAVIMAGGSGTRFWPARRTRLPKQLLPITGGLPMLAETVNRLDPLVPPELTWIVTNAEQVEGVHRICPQVPEENILVEPCGRNTAACVGFAATVIRHRDREATMAVLPADHCISPVDAFHRSLRAGEAAAARRDTFVTFGIAPTWPATGYGYIRRAGKVGEYEGVECYAVDSFTEKPDAETAARFLEEGVYFWNSGIFVWQTDTILGAIGTHMPELAAGLQAIHEAVGREDFARVVAEVYPRLPAVAVDVGIMEKVTGVVVLAAPYRWSDVGSWKALYEELPRDEAGNAAVFPAGGMLLAEDARGVLAWSTEPQVVAVLGLDDVVVVRTADALLVARRDRAEEVKRLVERLRDAGRDDVL